MNINNFSLKLKVTVWYTVVLLIVSFFILYAMTGVSQKVISRDLERQIVTSVNNLGDKLKVSNSSKEKLFPNHMFYDKGVQMALYTDNAVVFGDIPFGIEEEYEFSEELRVEKYNNKSYYIYDKMVSFGKDTYWLRGITCLTDELSAIQSTVKYCFYLIMLFVLLAGMGSYFIIHRAFVPVNKIRETAKEIAEGSDLSQRIDIGEGNDEISILANTFDDMLSKLETSFNKEKQFTSDASHELRTPISVILTECEYAEDCIDDLEECKESISSIKEQANKMNKLVHELLMISRMDNNRIVLNFEEMDISELLNTVCDNQEEIQTKKIELIRDIDDNIVAFVDTSLLIRLFINLISNAYQYSSENTKIIVSLYKEGDKFVFSVKDEGIGIAKENIDKIWDRFYQVDSSRTDDGTGSSGLGLSMVKWISDTHKGELKVESELGLGSTFSFTCNIKA